MRRFVLVTVLLLLLALLAIPVASAQVPNPSPPHTWRTEPWYYHRCDCSSGCYYLEPYGRWPVGVIQGAVISDLDGTPMSLCSDLRYGDTCAACWTTWDANPYTFGDSLRDVWRLVNSHR